MEKFLEVVGVIVVTIAILVALSALCAWPVMFLWNACLVGVVSGIKAIDFMSAWGIMLLCGLLFKPSGYIKK